MKSKYCFIQTKGRIGPETFIYVVWAGSSLRESAKLSLVEEYCKDLGFYFKKWGCTVDSALDEARKTIGEGANGGRFKFKMISVTIHELYNLIIDDSFGAIEKNYCETQGGLWFMFGDTIPYHEAMNQQKVSRHVNPHRRKNLSDEKLADSKRFVACMIGILAILTLDSIVYPILTNLFR